MSEQDRFRTLFDHSADPHFIFMDGGIVDCDDATLKILKLKDKKDVLKLHPARLSPAHQPDGRLSSEKSAEMDDLARKNGFHRFEWTHLNSLGEPFPVQVTLNAVTIDEKPAFIAVWHDLTDLKKREDELRRLNEKMKQDLQAAWAIQKALLPVSSPLVKGFRAAWAYKPCEDLGGDIFNVFGLDDKHVGIYMLDVVGHGLPAALLSVAVSHFLSPHSETSFVHHTHDGGRHAFAEPVEVATKLNRQFSSNPESTQIFTLIYGVLHVESGVFRYVCAGHPSLVLLTDEGARFVRGSDLPIGVDPDASFSEFTLEMQSCDRLYLYSDGATEAKDQARDLFGEQRFSEIISGARKASLSESLDRLARAVERWSHPHPIDDDLTLLACELTRPCSRS